MGPVNMRERVCLTADAGGAVVRSGRAASVTPGPALATRLERYNLAVVKRELRESVPLLLNLLGELLLRLPKKVA